MLESTIITYDFEVSCDISFVKLKALNAEAREWIRVVIIKPSGIICPPELDNVLIQSDLLEEVLRSLMAEGFKVNFIQG